MAQIAFLAVLNIWSCYVGPVLILKVQKHDVAMSRLTRTLTPIAIADPIAAKAAFAAIWAAKAEPVKAKKFATIGVSVPEDFAEQVRETAKRRRVTVSAFTMQALADAMANV